MVRPIKKNASCAADFFKCLGRPSHEPDGQLPTVKVQSQQRRRCACLLQHLQYLAMLRSTLVDARGRRSSKSCRRWGCCCNPAPALLLRFALLANVPPLALCGFSQCVDTFFGTAVSAKLRVWLSVADVCGLKHMSWLSRKQTCMMSSSVICRPANLRQTQRRTSTIMDHVRHRPF